MVTLSPYLAHFLNALKKGATLERSLNSAFITVIPKLGKDPSEVSNYRPISLINNDLKILTKILADQISSFISLYIHKHQIGFICGRQGPDQIRRAIDIILLFALGWDGGQPQEGFLLSTCRKYLTLSLGLISFLLTSTSKIP